MNNNKALIIPLTSFKANKKVSKRLLSLPLLAFFLFSLLLFYNVPLHPQQKEAEWLNQPITYLISPEERQIILGLQSPTEKEQFIRHFWQNRDPDLTTSINEFKVEFEKRVAFANRYFSTPQKEGWKSDRGKVYILLGQPTEIKRNPPQAGAPRSEVWIYNNIKCRSKFKNLRICYVDDAKDGDHKLSIPRSFGLEEVPLQSIGKEEQRFGISFSFNLKAPGYPKPFRSYVKSSKTFVTSPMEDLHHVADVIHIWRLLHITAKPPFPLPPSKQKYAHILPQFQTDFFQQSERLSYIPITIKLYYRDFAYIKRELKNYATMDVLALLYNKKGYLVNLISNRVSFGLSEGEKIEYLGDKPFNYQMGMTAPCGEYKLHLLVIDKVCNSYKANWIKEIKVPRWKKSDISLSSLILSNQTENIPTDKMYLIKGRQPYIFGNFKVIPNVSKIFKQRDNLSVFFKIYNPTLSSEGHLKSYKIEYIFYKDGRFFSKAPQHFPPASKMEESFILVNFRLINFYSGNYSLEVRVTDRKNNNSASEKIDFIIK